MNDPFSNEQPRSNPNPHQKPFTRGDREERGDAQITAEPNFDYGSCYTPSDDSDDWGD
jgi:hypothetical protein